MNHSRENESLRGTQLGHCSGDECISRRVLGHLGAPEGPGCALESFETSGDKQMANWLLSVKERVERLEAGTGE
jgi:hypothetical protein